MFKDRNIIYFSADDWGCGLTTSQTHITNVLAENNRILYINSIGLRRPSVSTRDAKKIFSKIKRCFQGIKQVEKNIFVVTPLVIPFHEYRLAQIANRKILTATIRYYQRKLKFKNPILWTFLPNTADMVGKFSEECSVYYCVDEFSAFAGVPTKEVQRMEQELLSKVNFTFCTSRELMDNKKQYNPNTYYMPHGVDIEHFGKALQAQTPIPEDMTKLGRPVIGFYGAIEEWVDQDLLVYIAQKKPEWNIVLVGRATVDVTKLSQCKNIYLYGPKSYKDLPSYSKSFDVAIIPFVINEITKHVNPIKLREYLAAGNPVVSTYLPELEDYRDFTTMAMNYEDFLQGIEKL